MITDAAIRSWLEDPEPRCAEPDDQPLALGHLALEEALTRALEHADCGSGPLGFLVRTVDHSGRVGHHRIEAKDNPACVVKELQADDRLLLVMTVGLIKAPGT